MIRIILAVLALAFPAMTMAQTPPPATVVVTFNKTRSAR